MSSLKPIVIFAALAATSVAVLTTTAKAQPISCGERDAIVAQLKRLYAEERTAVGVTSTGQLMEVMSSNDGTWTVLMTMPDGPTCLVASGDGWQGLDSSEHDAVAKRGVSFERR